MIVLSLFDGISAGRIALERIGVKIDKYYASEIDKYAIGVTQFNYPDTIQLGDVRRIKYVGGYLFSQNHPQGIKTKVDLVIGGSPCQGFSFSGAGLAFDDPRSALYFEFERILKEVRPDFWLLENVRMKKEHESVITERLGIAPIMIDSALVSAQSRKRLYWTNLIVEQPADKKIYLQDVLESGWTDSKKSFCIDANYYKGGSLKQYFEKSRRQLVFDGPIQVGYINQNHRGSRVYAINGKSVTLASNVGGWGMKTGLYITPKTPIVTLDRQERAEIMSDLVASGEFIIRKLTPLECERLQTMPDNTTQFGLFGGKVKKISNTQRYKMLGNSWTVDVIAHIFMQIKKDT